MWQVVPEHLECSVQLPEVLAQQVRVLPALPLAAPERWVQVQLVSPELGELVGLVLPLVVALSGWQRVPWQPEW